MLCIGEAQNFDESFWEEVLKATVTLRLSKVTELATDKTPKLRNVSMKYLELLLPKTDEEKENEILEEQGRLKDKAGQVLEIAKVYLEEAFSQISLLEKLL